MKRGILEKKYIKEILCCRVVDASTNKIVYRARGKAHGYMVRPMEAELEEFNNLKDWVAFVAENWRHDG